MRSSNNKSIPNWRDYDYKLHAICGLNGVIHSYDLSKASADDRKFMKDVKQTYHNCYVHGDKGYIGADAQLDLFETAHIRFECPYRINQKTGYRHSFPMQRRGKELKSFLATDGTNHAYQNKITNGLFARIIGKISALTVLQYANYIKGKPIG